MNVLLFCYKGNKYCIKTVLKHLPVFLLGLPRKNIILFKMSTQRIREKKFYFAYQAAVLLCCFFARRPRN